MRTEQQFVAAIDALQARVAALESVGGGQMEGQFIDVADEPPESVEVDGEAHGRILGECLRSELEAAVGAAVTRAVNRLRGRVD